MSEHLVFHTLDIEYNGHGPFTAVSENRLGLSVSITKGELLKYAMLTINIKIDANTTKHYHIKTIKLGDRIKLTYDGPNTDQGRPIAEIEELADPNGVEMPDLSDNRRYGFDVIRLDGSKNRLSYPKGGGMQIMLANAPLDHARVWVGAGNKNEDWSWQLDDLYAGDSLEFEFLTTDYTDEYPKVTRAVALESSSES